MELARSGVERETASLLADAVSAHHGFAIPLTEVVHVARFGLSPRWMSAVALLVRMVVETVARPLVPPRVARDSSGRTALMHWLAGLCAVSDWIGSHAMFFPHRRPWQDAATFYRSSRLLAQKALDGIGFPSSQGKALRTARRALDLALPPGHAPRPLQLTVQDAIDHLDGDEPALLIVEAPMGEGKTEAALAVDAHLRVRGGSRGLYLALPTQATSNAMYARVAAYLDRLDMDMPTELQLAHGGASLDAAVARLTEIGFGTDDCSVQASAWFATGKRALLAANAVGTIDQALVGVLHAKHHFVRMFGLSGRVVVLDEVHAYDAYTGGLIESLVRWLGALRCTVVVMSATLPRERLLSIVRAFGSAVEPPPTAYPRLTVVQGTATRSIACTASRAMRVSLHRLPASPATMAQFACELSAGGACVLVVCNTVARAQAVYRVIQSRPKAILFHARFPFAERLAIERLVVDTLGTAGTDRVGTIVVATQVVEQSLDIDADAMISDLAPVDLLLQRIGRLHRHPRIRPQVATEPRLWIAGLGDDGRVESAEIGHVYHEHLMLRTAAALRYRRVIELPNEVDPLVQLVYSSAPVEAAADGDRQIAEELARAEGAWRAELARFAQLAAQAAISSPDAWSGILQAPPQDDEAAANGLTRFGTRLGAASLSIVPLFQAELGLSVAPGGASWAVDQPVPVWAARLLAQRWLRVSHPKVVFALARAERLAGWDAHAALCRHTPVIFSEAGLCEVAGLRLHLDARLGLVYEYGAARQA